ncbi:MAG: hypothetical protein UY72_C0026G0008 [Candidatus Uhrbacteria bacterium GW2011_GWD2_52_7]|uniref:Uncharacterized protein n=1 Tax=Candidatus Uhrbacteria bacterium GW2011_GWD2_52_7 TaxID=1618989 RepID=A0A0G1XGD7_9BACT|nr:MAG: hypothetical protein UY72_C0026G0008 [Candidatus Uhrbacteria bacterium GW2011_GWD2_52_7]
MKQEQRKSIGTWLLVAGAVIVGLPIAYEVARFASDDFYRWVIHQPGFFSNLGSGPYLLSVHVASLLLAVPFIALGIVMRLSRDE